LEPDRQAETTNTAQPLLNLKDFREKAIAGLEKQYLKDLISQTGGNSKEARRISGLGKSRFYRLFKKHNLAL